MLTPEQDTRLQVPGPVRLTYGASTSQTGTDSGGSFNLMASGSPTYTLDKTIYQVGNSLTSLYQQRLADVLVAEERHRSRQFLRGRHATKIGNFLLAAVVAEWYNGRWIRRPGPRRGRAVRQQVEPKKV